MNVITYRVKLLEPTLVTALEGDPNSSVALSYLPGSALRGAVVVAYLRQQKQRELDLGSPTVRRLFFDASTRYLNAYRIDREERGIRSLPAPLSWQQCKDEVARQSDAQPAPVYDVAVEPADDDPMRQWQSVEAPFCGVRSDQVSLVQPERHLAVHTTRTRKYGRAMPADKIQADEITGAVFRYSALAADQTFEAAILCDHETDAANLLKLLSGDIRLGGSRSSGYGRARLEAASKRDGSTWRETGTPALTDAEVAGDRLIVTCLSDILLRNSYGQFAVDAPTVAAAVAKRLGISSVGLPDPCFMGGVTIGGFNRKWGLPLPQTPAIRMGSVFVFERPDCTISALRDLEQYGIGERRAEGFGRVAINWQVQETLQIVAAPRSRDTRITIPPDSPSAALARHMTQRMLRRRLDQSLTQSANSLALQITRPSNSQLSRLRLTLQRALLEPPEAGRERLTQYLNRLESRAVTRNQFTGDRIEGKTVMAWLRFRIADVDDVWRTLRIDTPSLPKIANISGTLTPELGYEYNLRLIDRTLAGAAQEQRGKG